MDNTQGFITLFWTVFFCLGWNLSLQEHNIFYFILKPFGNLYDKIKNQTELHKTFEPNKYDRDMLVIQKAVYFVLKPLILCITCMASVWGIIIFVTLNGFTWALTPYLILNCFASSFIQTFIWNIYARISNQ